MTMLRISAMALVCGLAIPLLATDPPEGYRATFQLGSASAPRGRDVRIPFLINSNPDTQAFSFSIDFDEEELEAGPELEHVFKMPDGTDWQFALFQVNNSNDTAGNGGIDEGYMVGVVLFSFTEFVALPVDTDSEVCSFSMHVRPDAAIGPTEVKFLDGAPDPQSNHPVENYVTLAGKGVVPDTKITPVFIQARLQIVPDISIFIRGDSNGDKSVDIADARATLSYLFQEGDPLPCLDAADANDDGKLNVSDPITTLQFLFLGRAPLPAPSGTQGEDPTSDGLDCAG